MVDTQAQFQFRDLVYDGQSCRENALRRGQRRHVCEKLRKLGSKVGEEREDVNNWRSR